MKIVGVTYGSDGDPYRCIPADLLNRALCRLLGLHGIGCRGRTDHDPITGRWHTRF